MLGRAKLQAGRQSHAVCVANVRLALEQLSTAGLDLSVSTPGYSVSVPNLCCISVVAVQVDSLGGPWAG